MARPIELNLGLVARACNSGLGTVSRAFFEHLQPTRTAVVENQVFRIFPERFPGAKVFTQATFDDRAVREFLKGLDVVVAIETPYNWNLFRIAREMGVKSILFPMYEMLRPDLPRPDLYACPSLIDYDEMPEPKVFLPIPVDLVRIPYRRRTQAKVFRHHAGHGGVLGRNGTAELLAAIPLVKSDVRFVIYSQTPLDFKHPKAQVAAVNVRDYWDLWHGPGDVFVFPHKFDGLSLPIQEALAAGMPLVATAIYPFTKWLPKDFLFPAAKVARVQLERPIDFATVAPKALAEAIDRMASRTDVAKLSRKAREIAETISWDALLPTYQTVFEGLCRKK